MVYPLRESVLRMGPKPYAPSRDDDIVLIMGTTGAGKSTFIKILTERDDVEVGHGMSSCTTQVNLFPYPRLGPTGKQLVLADTPGFGDTVKSDLEVLNILAEWLNENYKKGIIPCGILFFQMMTENPLSETSRKHLTLFRKIWGDECLKNVVIVTTMWDLLKEETGTKLENELRNDSKFWKPLIGRGSQIVRFEGSQASALRVVDLLKEKSPIPLQLQCEMGDERQTLDETAAGIAVNNNISYDSDAEERRPNTASTLVSSHPVKKEPKDQPDKEDSFFFTSSSGPLSRDDRVILIVGPAGPAKGMFIEALTKKKKKAGVAHKLYSDAIGVAIYFFRRPGHRRICLVGTPGFDDTQRWDADALEAVTTWLAASYKAGITPAGILFVQPITDNRMSGTTLKNLKMLRKLCGDECLRNVVLVTTMWSLVDPDKGQQRELDLISNFWKPLIDQGSQVARFVEDQSSALKAIGLLNTRTPLPLLVQRQIVDKRMTLVDTPVGIAVDTDLERKVKEHRQAILELRNEKHAVVRNGDRRLQGLVEEELMLVKEKHDRTAERRNLLKRNLWWLTGSI